MIARWEGGWGGWGWVEKVKEIRSIDWQLQNCQGNAKYSMRNIANKIVINMYGVSWV